MAERWGGGSPDFRHRSSTQLFATDELPELRLAALSSPMRRLNAGPLQPADGNTDQWYCNSWHADGTSGTEHGSSSAIAPSTAEEGWSKLEMQSALSAFKAAQTADSPEDTRPAVRLSPANDSLGNASSLDTSRVTATVAAAECVSEPSSHAAVIGAAEVAAVVDVGCCASTAHGGSGEPGLGKKAQPADAETEAALYVHPQRGECLARKTSVTSSVRPQPNLATARRCSPGQGNTPSHAPASWREAASVGRTSARVPLQHRQSKSNDRAAEAGKRRAQAARAVSERAQRVFTMQHALPLEPCGQRLPVQGRAQGRVQLSLGLGE